MQSGRIFYVGSSREVAHHVRPLASLLSVEAAEPAEVQRHVRPGDVAVFFSEHFDRFRSLIMQLRHQNIPTLYAIDGILEWRNAWENRADEIACPWTMRPCLSHVVATIGPRQTAILESWGNPQCVEVGLPRLDPLWNAAPPPREATENFRILVLTAKCPGFTPEQTQRTVESLQALQATVAANPVVAGRRIELHWRLSAGLEARVGVTDNQWTQAEAPEAGGLVAKLHHCDAVITTPSTAMLEAMLLGRPVALLDFHNTPTLADAAWRISADSQVLPAINQLIHFDRSPPHQNWQQFLLHENLAADGQATQRMVDILQLLLASSRRAADTTQPLSLPIEELRHRAQRTRPATPDLFSLLRPPRISFSTSLPSAPTRPALPGPTWSDSRGGQANFGTDSHGGQANFGTAPPETDPTTMPARPPLPGPARADSHGGQANFGTDSHGSQANFGTAPPETEPTTMPARPPLPGSARADSHGGQANFGTAPVEAADSHGGQANFGTSPVEADATTMSLTQWQAYTEQLERENQRLSRLVSEAHQVFENMQGHPVLGALLKSHERWSRWWRGTSGSLAKPDSWTEQ